MIFLRYDGNEQNSDLLRYAIQQEFNFSEIHLLLELTR